MDYTLSACLHVALQLLPRLLAEQASLLDGHCSANEGTASFYTKQDLWEKCFEFRTCFSFFSKNLIVSPENGSIMLRLLLHAVIEMVEKYVLLLQ